MKGISEILAEDRDVTAILTEKMKQQAESKVSDDDLAKAELLLTRLETKLHENFQEIYEQHFKGKEDDLMAVLLKQFPIVKGDTKSIVECKTSEISDKTKSLTDFDKVVYLTTTLAANCGEYKTKLYKAINTDDFKFAPLFAQEYPVRLAYAAAKNPALFNAVLNQFKDNNGKLIYPNLYNTIFIEGYHGVGKTSATANILNKILLDGDPDSFTYSAIIQRQADKLKASLGANEALTMDQMISEILNGNGKVGDYFENGNFKNILTDKV
jgi:chromosomal replication initiation ATPase DnaA